MAQDPWDLVLVGGGESLENIRSLARDIPGILFVGPEFGDSLCQYYALARALIVPSIIDPWGLVVNEGMASGLPVIVSRRCGSAKTLVHEGENGWTFESEDVDTLCGLLLRISSLPPDKLTEMGKKSKSVISDWSLDRFVDGVMAATQIPRRPPGGILSNILTRVWKGHVKVN
jgi:glycosyltransferase involved in cell wall biosynthesis